MISLQTLYGRSSFPFSSLFNEDSTNHKSEVEKSDYDELIESELKSSREEMNTSFIQDKKPGKPTFNASAIVFDLSVTSLEVMAR